jgi:hypothetical protein
LNPEQDVRNQSFSAGQHTNIVYVKSAQKKKHAKRMNISITSISTSLPFSHTSYSKAF